LKKKSWGFHIWFSLFSQEYRRMIWELHFITGL
jgi:hypothetical protein